MSRAVTQVADTVASGVKTVVKPTVAASVATSYIRLCGAYWNLGDFENGLEYSKKSIKLAEKIAKNNEAGNEKNFNGGRAYYWLGRFYSISGDYETALAFIRKSRNYFTNEAWFNIQAAAMGETHRLIGNYDSAMYYLAPLINKPGGQLGKTYISNLYVSIKQYDKALPLINEVIEQESKSNAISNLGYDYTIAAKAYLGMNNYTAALKNARTGYALLTKSKSNIKLIDNCLVLSDIFDKLGKNDSAYIYLKQYTTLKDSLLNRQFYIRLNDYKKEAEDAKRIGQINLLQKDNLIKEQECRQHVTEATKGGAACTFG